MYNAELAALWMIQSKTHTFTSFSPVLGWGGLICLRVLHYTDPREESVIGRNHCLSTGCDHDPTETWPFSSHTLFIPSMRSSCFSCWFSKVYELIVILVLVSRSIRVTQTFMICHNFQLSRVLYLYLSFLKKHVVTFSLFFLSPPSLPSPGWHCCALCGQRAILRL